MPKREPPLPSRAQALRARIYVLEEKLATAYPDKREALVEEIVEALTEYKELLPEIEAEARRMKDEVRREREATDRKRKDLLLLLGQSPEPQPTNAMGVALGTAPSFEKVYEYPLAELRHYGEPTQQAPRLISKQDAAAFRAMDEPSYWRSSNA